MESFDFQAPGPAEAYTDAPDLETEAATVAGLLATLAEEGAAVLNEQGPAVFLSERREVLLRAAAVADRRWWASRTDEALAAAQRAAESFVNHELLHLDEVAGPYGPDDAGWPAQEGGLLGYVRQEYWWWYNVPPGCGNCPPSDPCEWHAGRGDR